MARTPTAAAIALLALAAACKLVLAARWDPLADEAYFAVWSEHLALGYYDQPPAVAWAIAAGRALLGDTPLALRVHAVLAGLFGALVLLPHAGDRVFHALWWVAVPPLAWLTGFATPDALLLGCWAGVIAGGLTGGRGWWAAGVVGALGVWAKYPALAAYPLVVAGLSAWRDRDARVGAGLLGVLILPHAVWLGLNGLDPVRFQVGEGLLHPEPPGLLGPVAVAGQQIAVLTPFVALAVLGAWIRPPDGRAARVGLWSSLPVAGFFAIASVGGPPEAHWMAPAWIGAGLALSHARGRLARLAWFGVGTSLLASIALVLHAERGIFSLPVDPAWRLREGRVMAQIVASWALPERVGWREPGVDRAMPVRTERYQEAALIRWHTGIDARKQVGCGRTDQYDRWETSVGRPATAGRVAGRRSGRPEIPPEGRPTGSRQPKTSVGRPATADVRPSLYVRPARSGAPSCLPDGARLLQRAPGRDVDGRVLGSWDVWEIP